MQNDEDATYKPSVIQTIVREVEEIDNEAKLASINESKR